MNTTNKSMYKWNTIPWKEIERKVFKLQKRIYQASIRNEISKVHKLQKLLISSWSAKCLAIRKVSQDNRGKKTAGVDGVKSLTPSQRLKLVGKLGIKQKAHPIRRVWIPKPGKQEKRPLGIPTMENRALQMLVKLALEPEWEAKFEPNSYGFRPGRSAHDAIEAIYIAISQKPKYTLDADIEKCFDQINHKALLKKLNTLPSLRRAIKGWLTAGIMEGKKLYQSQKKGTQQGSPLSPLLAQIALYGLETTIKNSFQKYKRIKGKPTTWQPQIVVYADDLVIMHHDLQALIEAKEIATKWLKGIGLKFKTEKTSITHTLEKHEGYLGFNFLGFNIRQYKSKKKRLGFKTNIKPSKEAISKHLNNVKNRLQWKKQASQEDFINEFNSVIRGWANYYKSVVSSKIFCKLDHLMWMRLICWIKRKHPKTSLKKAIKKYFHKGWKFETLEGKKLLKYSSFKIKRHIKVQGRRSPFDGDFLYWATRMGKSLELSTRKAKLLKKQSGKCQWCKLYFKQGDILEVDHVIPIKFSGGRSYENLQLLHGHCHDSKSTVDLMLYKRGTDDNS